MTDTSNLKEPEFALINSSNRFLYPHLVDQMHEDRRKVFVDLLKWNIPVIDQRYEIDQFDVDSAVYLVALDQDSKDHLASVRLLPTLKPHLLSEIFPQLCETSVPKGANIFEITRLTTAPRVRGKAHRNLLRDRMALALVEHALEHGIAAYTAQAHLAWLSQLVGFGWRTEPLGLPQPIDGQLVGAIEIFIDPWTLGVMRTRQGVIHSVLENRERISQAA